MLIFLGASAHFPVADRGFRKINIIKRAHYARVRVYTPIYVYNTMSCVCVCVDNVYMYLYVFCKVQVPPRGARELSCRGTYAQALSPPAIISQRVYSCTYRYMYIHIYIRIIYILCATREDVGPCLLTTYSTEPITGLIIAKSFYCGFILRKRVVGIIGII